MRRNALLVIALAVVLLAIFTGRAHASPVGSLTPAHLTSAFNRTVHSDDGESVQLPNGDKLFLNGDITEVNGKSTVGKDGFPHSGFTLLSRRNVLTELPGKAGFGWQQVPNDGHDWYWFGAAVVQGKTLYAFARKIAPVPNCTGSFCFTVAGEAVAEFSVRTLRYERTVRLRGTQGVSAAVRNGTGWQLFGTSGETAHVPAGDLASRGAYHWTTDGLPKTSVSVIRDGARWLAFAFNGTVIDTLTSAAPAGPWTVTGTWTAPSGSYSVQAHWLRAGKVMVSYAESAQYYLHFRYLRA